MKLTTVSDPRVTFPTTARLGTQFALYEVSGQSIVVDRCEALTARNTRCRADATWVVYEPGNTMNSVFTHPYRTCARHLNNHRRGWW
jgi:hypothetical protein